MGAFSEADLKALLTNSSAALRELDRIECEESLLFFVRKFWYVLEPGRELVDGWPLQAICAHLEAVTNGDIQKILMNVPPGFMKSLLTEVFWPAWEWGPRGMANMRFVSFSYSAMLTERDNRRFKDLILSPEYQAMWGGKLGFTLFKQGETLVTNDKSGWKLATSIGGVGTGERGDRICLDDPHNVREAESDPVRTSTVQWFRESMSNRLNDMQRSAVVVIMQRVHEGDVSGAIITDLRDEYEHLLIPMEYDGRRYHTSIGWTDPREDDGELAWPSRFPAKTVSGMKKTLGHYAYASQYQQTPVPRGGGIFRYEWWQDWGNPDDFDDPHFKRFPAFDYIVASLDGAYTEKDENDYSALTVWGVFYDNGLLTEQTKVINAHPLANELGVKTASRTEQRSMQDSPKIMLVTAWQARLTLHELVAKVADTCKKRGVHRLLIEAKGPGISVAQEIRRLHAGSGWGVQLIDPGRSDKVARAYSVQPMFEDEMVYTPNWPPREWAEMVKDQMGSFPKATHDDLTDSATQALKHLRDTGMAVHEDEVERDYQEAARYKGAPSKPLYPT